MSDPGPISLGEAGGLFSGAIAILVTIGGGIRWLLGWKDRREESRAAKLQAWHEELKEREAKLDAERAGELASLREDMAGLRREHSVLFSAYQLIAEALRGADPTNPALRIATDMLRQAFPVEPIPADMGAALQRLDAAPGQP